MNKVKIHGERGERWRVAVGTNEFPVVSVVPFLANLPGFDEPQRVYLLDLDAVEPDLREAIIAELARAFGLPPNEAEDEIRGHGIPILEQDCTWMSDEILRHAL